jgi:hypothetical protein
MRLRVRRTLSPGEQRHLIPPTFIPRKMLIFLIYFSSNNYVVDSNEFRAISEKRRSNLIETAEEFRFAKKIEKHPASVTISGEEHQ